MPTLVIRGPDGTLVERELEGRLTVGCDDDNDLVLRSGGVEKRHANFFSDGGEVVLEQLDFSAAQTLVDGAPLKGRQRLQPGVRVLIGGYEVHVKPGAQQLSVRRIDAPPADTLTGADPDTPVPSFPFKVVFGLFAVALLSIVGLGTWRRLERADLEAHPPPPPPACNVEPDLQIARVGPSPKALEAAKRALDCEPINPEANALVRSIPRELEGQGLLTRAHEFIELDRDEQALDVLEKIPEGTEVARTALPVLGEVVTRLEKRCLKDKSPLCADVARVRKSLEPPKPSEPPGPSLRERVTQRLKTARLVDATLLYAEGRTSEAIAKLQLEPGPLRDTLRKDLSNADGLYKVGQHALEKGDLDRAAKAFGDTLAIDAKILPEGGGAMKKTIEHELAARAYELGAVQAQHQNWLRACAAWKVGFSFFKGDTPLNTAVTNDCTNRARGLVDSQSCKDLDDAAQLAVPGDELAPVIAERRAGLHCKP